MMIMTQYSNMGKWACPKCKQYFDGDKGGFPPEYKPVGSKCPACNTMLIDPFEELAKLEHVQKEIQKPARNHIRKLLALEEKVDAAKLVYRENTTLHAMIEKKEGRIRDLEDELQGIFLDAYVQIEQRGAPDYEQFYKNTMYQGPEQVPSENATRAKNIHQQLAIANKRIAELEHRTKGMNCHGCGKEKDTALCWTFDSWICDTCMEKQLDNFVLHRNLKVELAKLKAEKESIVAENRKQQDKLLYIHELAHDAAESLLPAQSIALIIKCVEQPAADPKMESEKP